MPKKIRLDPVFRWDVKREGRAAKEETTSTDFFWNKVRKQRLDKGIGAFGTIVVAIYGIICMRLPYILAEM